MLVFVAGKERVAGAQTSLGFEGIRSARMTEEEREELEGNALDVFRESEVKKPFANRALTSPPTIRCGSPPSKRC